MQRPEKTVVNPWRDLPPGPNPPEHITVIVETPASSRNKYELDKQCGVFRLDRVLFSAVHYPGDYGFVPRTLWDDGDPLDVLLLTKEPTFTGCLVPARPLGLLRMIDSDQSDDKIVAVPMRDPHQAEFFDIADIPQHLLREIADFFRTYKELEGKHVQILGWEKSEVALREISRSIRQYRERWSDSNA